MQSIISKSLTGEQGRKAENAVALQMKRLGEEIQYYKGKQEVDFVLKRAMKLIAINVSYTPQIPKREYCGIEEFSKNHKNTKTHILDDEKIRLFLEEKLTIGEDNVHPQ